MFVFSSISFGHLDILKLHFTGVLIYIKNNSKIRMYSFIDTKIVLITCLLFLFLIDFKIVSYAYTKL